VKHKYCELNWTELKGESWCLYGVLYAAAKPKTRLAKYSTTMEAIQATNCSQMLYVLYYVLVDVFLVYVVSLQIELLDDKWCPQPTRRLTLPNLSIFVESDLIRSNWSCCYEIILILDLQCNVFRSVMFSFYEYKCLSSFENGIFDDVKYDVISTLRYCSVGVNFLIFQYADCWSIGMFLVNNYETMSTFSKVMPRIL